MGTLKLYSDGGMDYFERKNSTGMFDLQIGKFNQANIFTRYPGKIELNPTFRENQKDLKEKYNPELNVKVTYQIADYVPSEVILTKETAEKFFTTERVKDDYLQTCKNSDGKTIFDIFKE